MFWSTLLGAFFTLACTLTTSFPVFYGFRALMGLFLTSYQVAGLAVIKVQPFFDTTQDACADHCLGHVLFS